MDGSEPVPSPARAPGRTSVSAPGPVTGVTSAGPPPAAAPPGESDPAPRGRALVVAIDGPSGSGKSTVAREVARRLGLRYLDTGAMYRAVTWLALRDRVDLADERALTDLAEQADLRIGTDPSAPSVQVGDVDVATAIRSEEVTSAVSAVSAVPGVRAVLVGRQRELVGDGGVVVEGRDIGSVVVPDADVKVFLTATSTTRAHRRARETRGDRVSAEAVDRTHSALQHRDRLDSARRASPLLRAPDAVEIDSTALDVDGVVASVLALVAAGARR